MYLRHHARSSDFLIDDRELNRTHKTETPSPATRYKLRTDLLFTVFLFVISPAIVRQYSAPSGLILARKTKVGSSTPMSISLFGRQFKSCVFSQFWSPVRILCLFSVLVASSNPVYFLSFGRQFESCRIPHLKVASSNPGYPITFST